MTLKASKRQAGDLMLSSRVVQMLLDERQAKPVMCCKVEPVQSV